MTEESAKELLQKIALTLKYCHEVGVSHRDLKSDNVLINEAGEIMLIDFAFSFCSLSGKKTESYCGTPSYMSPEVLSKQPHCPKKADVWAFGILAYKILTGDHPFNGKPAVDQATNDQETIEERIVREEYNRELVSSFSRSFNNFLGRTLEKCPEKRSTIKEVTWFYKAFTRFLDQAELNYES